MNTRNCLELKELEEQLACLEEKYKEITDQLEEEQKNGMISDEIWGYQSLLEERRFIVKQIDRLRKRLEVREKFISFKKETDKIGIGTCVRLQNHKTSIEVCLVSQDDTVPVKGYISTSSPIGKAIIGKQVGDEVVVVLPSGEIPYKIKQIL